MCVEGHGCLWRPEEGVRSQGVGVVGGCELHDKGAEMELRSSKGATLDSQSLRCPQHIIKRKGGRVSAADSSVIKTTR